MHGPSRTCTRARYLPRRGVRYESLPRGQRRPGALPHDGFVTLVGGPVETLQPLHRSAGSAGAAGEHVTHVQSGACWLQSVESFEPGTLLPAPSGGAHSGVTPFSTHSELCSQVDLLVQQMWLGDLTASNRGSCSALCHA